MLPRALLFLALLPATVPAADPNAHPLDPLTKDEILGTVETLRAAGQATATSSYSLIALHEPPKTEVLNWAPGQSFRRESFAVVYERAKNQTFEAIVDLRAHAVLSWKQIPGVQPSFLLEDAEILERAIRADPRFAEALHKRGITDLANVGIGDWPGGYFGDARTAGLRFRRAEFFYHDAENSSDRVIENINAEVDLRTGKVIRFQDDGPVAIPAVGAGLDAIRVTQPREAPKPLLIEQPQGPGFTVKGHEVRWQNWRFRFSLHGREGLVLYTVGYEDGGKLRPILYRGSCSEMVVPYGDPSAGWFFKNAFDAGEDSFGRYAAPLEPQKDYPANAATFDAVLASERGDWFRIPRAVALYERDGGLLWKHDDRGRTRNESRRSRELVLSWIATVGNYDYAFNWVFHQDATLEMEVLLTGFMETKAVNLKQAPHAHDHTGELRFGHLVAENVLAVHHQHFFNFRLDLDIDGVQNSVLEMNTHALPMSPSNPYGNAFTMEETVFHNEQEAERQMSLAESRRWTIFNPLAKNALGEFTGYTLLPGENSVPYPGPGSWVRKRASFVNAPFWVTPFDPNQMYAAGFYVNQSKGDDGLEHWVEAKRPIENQDLVVWYTMGITHIPRPEEYPVMSVHKAGFKLVPNGFFTQNPAIDLP